VSGCARAQHAVTPTAAPDYHRFVREGDEMCLAQIERKIKGARYGAGAELRADVARIVANAAAYNAPGCGKYGGPGAGS